MRTDKPDSVRTRMKAEARTTSSGAGSAFELVKIAKPRALRARSNSSLNALGSRRLTNTGGRLTLPLEPAFWCVKSRLNYETGFAHVKSSTDFIAGLKFHFSSSPLTVPSSILAKIQAASGMAKSSVKGM